MYRSTRSLFLLHTSRVLHATRGAALDEETRHLTTLKRTLASIRSSYTMEVEPVKHTREIFTVESREVKPAYEAWAEGLHPLQAFRADETNEVRVHDVSKRSRVNQIKDAPDRSAIKAFLG